MFDIDQSALGATVRCKACPATLAVDSDDQRIIKQAIADYVRQHRCRQNPSVPSGRPSTESGSGAHP